MKGVNLMGKRRHGQLAALGATTLAAAIAAAGFASGTASAVVAKPGTIAASGATSTTARATALTVAASYTPPKRTLKEGMTGADVKALQSRLAALKYYPGPIDGAFGTAQWFYKDLHIAENGSGTPIYIYK
jgi:peptidoglycan hydrolase-like protein with peptidoglycan-binding domain